MLIPYASAETVPQMAAGLAEWKEKFLAAGGSRDAAVVPFGFHCHCAETTAQARAEAREPMERYVRTRLYAVQRSFDTLVGQDVVAFGDPDEITSVRFSTRGQASPTSSPSPISAGCRTTACFAPWSSLRSGPAALP